MTDRELRAALRDATPIDPAARERAWRVVRAAHADGVPAVPAARRRWATPAVAVILAVLAVGTAAAATAPHSGVGRLVRGVLGVGGGVGAPHARPALVHVPGGGRLLTQAGSSTWIVAPDGSRRRLGAYAGASWSPHGLFVAAWHGHVLSAVEPGGRVRWTISALAPIRLARWAPVDGFRVAYLSGGALRVVDGDGTGDHRVAAARQDVAPAWRPDAAHVLAVVDARDRLTVLAADTGARLWRTTPLRGLTQLAWSADGRRLAALSSNRLRVFATTGTLLASRPAPRQTALTSLAWSPTGRRLAVVQGDGSRSAVTLRNAHGRLAGRALFSGPGRLGPAAWSPNGRWLLVPWPAADQWLFLRATGGARVTAVGNVAAQISPGAARPRFPSAVQWCC